MKKMIIAIIIIILIMIMVIVGYKIYEYCIEFRLDNANKYLVTTDTRFSTMRNDGGSHENIYYGIDLEKGEVTKYQQSVNVYLDLGFDTVKRVILGIIVPYIENPKVIFFNDYKSALQEFVQTEQRSLVYEVVSEDGPAHNKSFTVNVKVDDIVYGTGTAPSKKEAEQEAAHDAIRKLAL